MWFKKKSEAFTEPKSDVLFLPADGNKLNIDFQPSSWMGYRANLINNIADKLPLISDSLKNCGKENEIKMDEFSIPSPWARFILFDTSLYNQGLNNLHSRIKDEWRGLLALLALRDIRGLKIDIEPIDIEADKSTLYKIISLNKPSNYIFEEDKAWNRIYAIILDKTYTIGMLSASTLVCTPYEYDNRTKMELDSKIKWFRNGTFVNPVDYLDTEYASALFHWLNDLRELLKNHSRNVMDPKRVVDTLIGFINEFGEDINNAIRTKGEKMQSRQNFIFSDSEYAMYGVHGLFGHTVNIDINDTTSDLAVYNKQNCIIVGRKMWDIESNHDKADKIRVFSKVTLGDYPDYFTNKSSRFGEHTVPEGLMLYKAEELFKDDLYLVKLLSAGNGGTNSTESNNMSNGAFDDIDVEDFKKGNGYSSVIEYNGTKYSIIWPVHKQIFEFMSPGEIKDCIKVRVHKDGKIEISIKIKVIGPSFLKRPGQDYIELELSKIYDNKNANYNNPLEMLNGKIIIKDAIVNFPIVAIWPHHEYILTQATERGLIEKNIWNKYYTFIGNDIGSEYDIEPVYNNEDRYELNKLPDNKYFKCKVIHSDALPEYAVVKFKSENSQLSMEEIGIVLLKKAKKINIDTNKTWKVGLDFGTTSTSAFYDDGKYEKFIKFGKTFARDTDGKFKYDSNVSDDIYFATQNSVDEAFYDPAYKYFLPFAYLDKNMYLSMYESLRDTYSGEVGTELKAFSEGHVFYHSTKVRLEASSSSIHKDLKWGNENENKAARKYLMQVILQCAQKAASSGVSKIEWRFSYPTALGRDKIGLYKASLGSILEKVNQETGIEMSRANSLFCTESIASSLFFRNVESGKPLPTEQFVCIDIGGGSTDISIWQGNGEGSNKLQTSFRFASRDIFLNSLYKSKHVFSQLFVNNADNRAKDRLDRNRNQRDFHSQVEYELFENEDQIKHTRLNIQGEEYYKNFIKGVSLGFLGIMYYVTMLLDNLHKKGESENSSTIKIYLSGNGAKLYDWVVDYITQETLEKYLTNMMSHNGVNKVKIFYNKQTLKTEASKGLLFVRDTNEMNEFNDKLIAGEKFMVIPKNSKSIEMEWSSNLAENNSKLIEDYFTGDIDIKPTRDFENLKRFVQMFNELFKEKTRKDQIDLSSGLLNDLAGKVEEKLILLKEERRMDPIFILSVQSLLELMLDENKK